MRAQTYSGDDDLTYAEKQERKNGRGGRIETYTGGSFYPLDPSPEDIDIRDIAHALSLNCRYNGHCEVFYSVAEHSVSMSWHLQEQEDAQVDDALWALLHDATEAYLPDMPRPVKSLVEGFDEAEERIHRVLADRFGLPWPIPEEIHRLDDVILADEARQLMESGGEDWVLPEEGEGIAVSGWSPKDSEWNFLHEYEKLTGDVVIDWDDEKRMKERGCAV